ncbi:hypothetical protein F4774DRAFT_410108 [Daldinia eschscholtzii]|nr:hypothetical protein F4774DRAFT_410108 [Daldinia eschscholtzii]
MSHHSKALSSTKANAVRTRLAQLGEHSSEAGLLTPRLSSISENVSQQSASTAAIPNDDSDSDVPLIIGFQSRCAKRRADAELRNARTEKRRAVASPSSNGKSPSPSGAAELLGVPPTLRRHCNLTAAAPRDPGCLRCLRSLLFGRIEQPGCFNHNGTSGKCYRCVLNNHACEKIPDVALPWAVMFLQLHAQGGAAESRRRIHEAISTESFLRREQETLVDPVILEARRASQEPQGEVVLARRSPRDKEEELEEALERAFGGRGGGRGDGVAEDGEYGEYVEDDGQEPAYNAGSEEYSGAGNGDPDIVPMEVDVADLPDEPFNDALSHVSLHDSSGGDGYPDVVELEADTAGLPDEQHDDGASRISLDNSGGFGGLLD